MDNSIEVPLNLQQRRIIILSPVGRAPQSGYMMSLLKTMLTFSEIGVPLSYKPLFGHANTPRARNLLIARALSELPEWTDFVFIDSDMVWSPEEFLKLFMVPEQAYIVAGVPQRRNSEIVNFAVNFQGDGIQICRKTGLTRGLSATAFLRIQRPVFTAMRDDFNRLDEDIAKIKEDVLEFAQARGTGELANWLERNLNGKKFFHEAVADSTAEDWLYAFFDYRVGTVQDKDPKNTYIGEDFEFLKNAKRLGFDVFLRPDIRLGHIDEVALDANLADVLQDPTAKIDLPVEWVEDIMKLSEEKGYVGFTNYRTKLEPPRGFRAQAVGRGDEKGLHNDSPSECSARADTTSNTPQNGQAQPQAGSAQGTPAQGGPAQTPQTRVSAAA